MPHHNLAQVLRHQAERLGPRPALRFKRHGLYHDVDWRTYASDASAAAAALVDVGVLPGDRVGLLGENSADWLIADMAILTAGAVNVPPHAPLTARQIHYQLADSEAVWAIVSDRVQLEKLRSVRAELPALRGVVAFDPALHGADVVSWDAFCTRGRLALARLREELARRDALTGPDSLATVMYTSGTTGNPKGVMLTHGNLLSNAVACLQLQPYDADSLVLNWLPYTHIYARTVDHYTPLVGGVTIALAVSAETLVENFADVQPTHCACVPRFYEKVLGAVAAPDPAETARRLRRVFGPRIQFLSSGGAPLPVAIGRSFTEAGLPLLQGYGLTETSPVISFNTKTHNKLGTVGRAIPGVEVRIAADGEVLTRGPHVMPGYWKNPQATADTIRDGWLYTGDLGSLDADGYLSITGRKKEMMVLSNGKKVAPSNIEGLVLADPCIDQVVLVGEGRNFLTALLVPNWANVRSALARTGVTLPESNEACAAHPEVCELLSNRCHQALQEVSHMERIKRVAVLPRPFSIEADEMTVSLKLRRDVVLRHNADRIEEMYKE